MRQPSCTILAGPNGSGKTSIYHELQPPGEFVNVDEIEKTLKQEANGVSQDGLRVKAGRIALDRVRQLIDTQADFVLETTLSGFYAVDVMRRAKASGYNVGLVYVILDSPQRSIERVRFRVRSGGHDIPAADIWRRYDRSLRNLEAALKLANESVIMDNSPKTPLFLFEKGEDLHIREYDSDIELHRRLIVIVERAFTEELDRKRQAKQARDDM